VSIGEAAHPAVTSMGTWCKLGKQIPTVHDIVGKDPGGTLRHIAASCGLLVLLQEIYQC